MCSLAVSEVHRLASDKESLGSFGVAVLVMVAKVYVRVVLKT